MECLPFVKRIANLRSYMVPESPGTYSRKVFLSGSRKQRRSTCDSSGSSSIDSEQTLQSDLTVHNSTISSQHAVPSSIASDSDLYSTSTGGYMEDLSPFQNRQGSLSFDQLTTTCDESTVFSFSNERDIVIALKDSEDFLGISIVGQNYSNGESNLFVGAVIPGGAVSRNGTIQPGDIILAVNGESLDGRSNQEAVDMLRKAVKSHREVTLTIVGNWDEESVYSDGTCVRPIDPLLWLAHNSLMHKSDEAGLTQNYVPPPPRFRTLRSQTSIASSSLSSSMPSTAARQRAHFQQQAMPLETPTDIIANRLRLFIVARNNSREAAQTSRNTMSINGVELQMWLYRNMRGFKDLAEVENYATHMISNNYLKPTSTYLLPGVSSQQQFNRRESYIVNTRPTTPATPSSSMLPCTVVAMRSLTPVTHSSYRTSRSSTPLSMCEEIPTDKVQLLHNQLTSTGLSIRRY